MMPSKRFSFAVLGAGSWGTAIAMLLANNGCQTTLWARNQSQVQAMSNSRTNACYLGDVKLPDSLDLTSSLEEALSGSDVVLVAVPSHAFREILQQTKAHVKQQGKLVWVCKGLELGTGKLLHDVAKEVCGDEIDLAFISGPNFAKEVACNIPTATTVASPNLTFANTIAQHLHNDWFRAYSTEDIIGVQLGGALKNPLAIAAGIADGLSYGANTRAALLTRGLAEMMRLGCLMGGLQETFMGLAGMGDLILTCTDNQSRNRRLGLALAQGKGLDAAVAEIGQAVEGIKSAQAAYELAKQLGVEAPIIEQTYKVLYEDLQPEVAVKYLLSREQKAE